MLPQARLVAKLKSLEAVTALIGQSVWPIIAPQGTAYPHLVYQVLSDDPVNSAGGTTPTSNMKIRIAALALVSGGQAPTAPPGPWPRRCGEIATRPPPLA